MSGKNKVLFTIEIPKTVKKGRVVHRPTKSENPRKGKTSYNRKREKHNWQKP